MRSAIYMQIFDISILIISQIVWAMQVHENLVLSSVTFAIRDRNLHANPDDVTSSGNVSTYLKQNRENTELRHFYVVCTVHHIVMCR